MASVRVGIIGVNARGGWAAEAHLPAVRAVDGLELVAVASGSQASADEVTRAFDVPRAFANGSELIASPEVDLVTVAAPVPRHRELILAALDAGKHVVTEWPVGVDTAQALDVAEAAAVSQARVFVNLQARVNPVVSRLRELIARGAIGRVLGATVYSSTAGWGPVVPAAAAALEEPATGMNLLTIQTAHTLDLVELLLGPYTSLSAQTTVQYPQVQVGDEAEPRPRSVPDHVLVNARSGRSWAAIQVAGGRPADASPFRLTVTGTDGQLALLGGTPRGFQAGRLSLEHDGTPIAVPDPTTDALPDAVVNVARMYAAIRDDVRDGTHAAPTAEDGVATARLVDAAAVSSSEARSVALDRDTSSHR